MAIQVGDKVPDVTLQATIDGGMKRIGQLFEQMREDSAVLVPGSTAAELNTDVDMKVDNLFVVKKEQ